MDPVVGILRNWSLLGGAQALASLVAMAFTVLVSRALGDVEFGRLYLALTVAAIVGVVADLGLSQVTTRMVARDRATAGPTLRRGAALVAMAGALLYLGLLGAARALELGDEVRTLVVIFGVLVVAEAFAQLLGAAFAGHERMLVPALTKVAGNVIALALVVPVLLRGQGAAAVALVLVSAAVVRVAIQAIAVRRLCGSPSPTTPPSWGALLRAGAPFIAAQGLGMFVVRIDVVILGRLAGDASVGWYGAATRLSEAVNLIPIVLTTATFPVLSRLWVGATDEFRATLRRMTQLVLVISLPVAVTLALLAADVVGLLLTLRSYAPAVPILTIQALTLPLVFVDYLLVCALMAIGRERTWLAIVAVACAFVPALDWAFISLAGAAYGNGGLGAALATGLTEVFFLACTLRALPRGTFGADSLRLALATVAVGLLQAIVLLTLRSWGAPAVVAAAIAVACYLVAVVRLGLVPHDVTTWLRALPLRRGPPPRTPAVPSVSGPGDVEAA